MQALDCGVTPSCELIRHPKYVSMSRMTAVLLEDVIIHVLAFI